MLKRIVGLWLWGVTSCSVMAAQPMQLYLTDISPMPGDATRLIISWAMLPDTEHHASEIVRCSDYNYCHYGIFMSYCPGSVDDFTKRCPPNPLQYHQLALYNGTSPSGNQRYMTTKLSGPTSYRDANDSLSPKYGTANLSRIQFGYFDKEGWIAQICVGTYNLFTSSPPILAYPGACMSVPAPTNNTSCDISSGSLELEHGSLGSTYEQLNGKSATGSFSVLCNKDTAVTLTLSDNYLSLYQKSLISRLTITRDGEQILSSTPNPIKGNTPTRYDITSTLMATPGAQFPPNKYSGSAILIISVL